jgi:hypothetical protein
MAVLRRRRFWVQSSGCGLPHGNANAWLAGFQGDGITGTFGDGFNAAETSVDDRDLAEFDAARLERCPNCRCDADGRGNGDDCGNRHEESNLVGGFCTHASALSFSVSLTP